MRRRYVGLALLAVALLLVTHWMIAYRPRERPRAPRADTPTGRIFADSELPYRVWLPYPHQNLAELERALGDVEQFLRAVAELTGRPMPRLPRFGAARVPPSSQLVLATDESGERFIAAADVYPLPGLLSRWAGRLANNPLLSGGRTEIDGRPVEAAWVEGSWVVATDGVAAPSAADEAPRIDSALAWVSLAAPRGRLPAGRYSLERDEDDLVLRGGDASTLEELERAASRAVPVPLLAVETFGSRRGREARALGLVPGVESIGGLPGALAVHSGSRRWRLPGERVLDLIGDGVRRETVGGWKVAGLDHESLARGSAVVDFAGALAEHPPLSVAVWIEVREARRLVVQVVEALEAIPVIGEREARRWRAAAEVLRPFARYERLTALVSTQPAAVLARLESDPVPGSRGDGAREGAAEASAAN